MTRFAANLSEPRESNGRVGGDLAAVATHGDPPWPGSSAGRPLWVILAVVALTVSVAEWILHQRRVLE